MENRSSLIGGVLLGAALAAQAALGTDRGPADSRYWPQWRGPLMTGVAPTGDPPVEWSDTKGVR